MSGWLGHTRTSTTDRIYAHEIRSMQAVAGERMRAQMDARQTVNETVNTDAVPVAPADTPTFPGAGS